MPSTALHLTGTVHSFGVDVEGLERASRTQEHVRDGGEPLRVLFAGTFREKKGVPDLIEAMYLLRRDGAPVHLELVGDAAGKKARPWSVWPEPATSWSVRA